MQVAAQAGCKCYGIEIREDLHELAEKISGNYHRKMQEREIVHGEVNLILVRPNLYRAFTR